MQVTPENELIFKRVNGATPKQVITITNTSHSTTMAFKVKTTAPKLFAVRPNFGKLKPQESIEVFIAFQVTIVNKQTRDDQPFDTKRKDKFLVQSIVIPEMDDQEFQDKMTDLWEQAKQLKAASPENPNGLMEKMLKCAYLEDEEITDRKSVVNASEPEKGTRD